MTVSATYRNPIHTEIVHRLTTPTRCKCNAIPMTVRSYDQWVVSCPGCGYSGKPAMTGALAVMEWNQEMNK